MVCVQVLSHSVLILENAIVRQEIELNSAVHSASVCGDFLLLLDVSGNLTLIEPSLEDGKQWRKRVLSNHFPKNLGVPTAMTLFSSELSPKNSAIFSEFWIQHPEKKIFAVVAWSCGSFEIYSLPDFASVWTSHFTTYFGFEPGSYPVQTLADRGPVTSQLYSAKKEPHNFVEEITVAYLGRVHCDEPYLMMIMSSGKCYAYRSFAWAPEMVSDALEFPSNTRLTHLRFARFDFDQILAKKQTKSHTFKRLGENSHNGPDTDFESDSSSDSDSEEYPHHETNTAPQMFSATPDTEIDLTLTPVQRPLQDLSESVFEKLLTRGKTQTPLVPRLLSFDNIGGYRGVFLAGENPHWFFAEKGLLRAHPGLVDANPIASFIPFHNFLCRRGFIYYNAQGLLRICQLPPNVNFNAAWPTRKIPTRGLTPRKIAYHRASKAYVVVACQTVDYVSEETEPQQPKGDRFLPITEEKYTLLLLKQTADISSPIDVFPIQREENEPKYVTSLPSTANPLLASTKQSNPFNFEQHERVLSIRVVGLTRNFAKEREEAEEDEDSSEAQERYYQKKKLELMGIKSEETKQSKSELMDMLAVGTAAHVGEDSSCRGRIMIFDIVPDETRFSEDPDAIKFKTVYEKQLNAPVTALGYVNGYLAVAAGPKIYIYHYDWKAAQLVPASFYDTQFYVVSINSIKNFLVIGDAYRGVQFVRWREDNHSLTLLGKEPHRVSVSASDFLVNGTSLSMIVADEKKNVQMVEYDPRNLESLGGRKLLAKADFHVGSTIRQMVRVRVPAQLRLAQSPTQQQSLAVHGVLYGSEQGSLGFFVPLDEDTFRKLSTLQNKMYVTVHHHCGLHPKAFRLFRSEDKHHTMSVKNTIDGQLLWMFPQLTPVLQHSLARHIDTSVSDILAFIRQVDALLTNCF